MPALVHLFLGRENTLKEEALSDLKRETLSGGDADLNYALFYPDQFDPHEFQNAVNTGPFLSPMRYVVIKDIDALPQEGKQAVLNYVTNPSATTVLAMTSALGRNEISSDSIVSDIAKHANVRYFESLEGERLRRYVSDRAASFGKRIDRDAVELVISKIGDDLGYLNMAAEKLANYAGDRDPITKKDVEALVGRSLEEDVFDMTRAMSEGKTAVSLAILSDLLRDSTRPENIIGAIGAELKRSARMRGPSEQAKGWLKECFDRLSQADHDLKNRDLDKKVILETLVVRLSELSQLG